MNRKEAEQKAKQKSNEDEGKFYHVVRYDVVVSDTAPDGLSYRVTTARPSPLDRPLGTLVSSWLNGEQIKTEEDDRSVTFGDNASGNLTITGGIGGDFVLGKSKR